MATSKFYKTTISEEEVNVTASTRNLSSDAEALLVTKTVDRGQDQIRHIGQVFTTSERPVLHGIAVTTDHTESGSEQWGMYTLDGITLRQIFEALKAGKNEEDVEHGSVHDRIHIVMHAADAITYANEHDILHNDLKPDNIIINMRGDIAVVERTHIGKDVALEANEQNIDPTYFSPEQARGEDTNALSDVYSLGVVLFEALTLRTPFEAEDRKSLWELKRNGTIRHFTDEELKQVHPAMVAIVRKALDPNPNLRYACADVLRSDLDNFF